MIKKKISKKHTKQSLSDEQGVVEPTVREPRRIDSNLTQVCAFCGCKDVRGGSWSPDRCTDCGATYFFGSWWENVDGN